MEEQHISLVDRADQENSPERASQPGEQTQQTQQGRPIGFHEPHPGNKLPLARAREYGRRLQRAYGWSGDMFVLDD